jgi:ATP/maltotriose-dependent transcriptional regulator MalT
LEGRYDDALEIAETATGHEGTVTARCGYPEDVIADVALYRGEAEVALGHYRRVATDAAAEGDAARLLWATYYQSVISSVLGRTDDARDAARVVLDDARR